VGIVTAATEGVAADFCYHTGLWCFAPDQVSLLLLATINQSAAFFFHV
jgi:hypothetical protein